MITLLDMLLEAHPDLETENFSVSEDAKPFLRILRKKSAKRGFGKSSNGYPMKANDILKLLSETEVKGAE